MAKTRFKDLPKKWQEGEYTVHRSTVWSAPGCHEGCGVLLYVKDGRVAKVEGDTEHPFNHGGLCARCPASPDVFYHKDRLKWPLKRVGLRGENKWERISWDEALDTIEKEFRKIIDTYGAEAICGCTGTGRDVMWQGNRWIYTLGSPNVVGPLSGLSCYMPRAVASQACCGSFYPCADCAQYWEDGYDNPKWKLPEYIVCWGSDPIYSNTDWFLGQWIVECMKRGSKVISVDPRCTYLSARAEYWLQCRPGMDAPIAMALAKVIIDEELWDKDFIDNWSFGFDKYVERLKEYDLNFLCERAWLPVEKVKTVARVLAKAKPVAYHIGLATDMQRIGLWAAQAIMLLEGMTGNIDQPGGCMLPLSPLGITPPMFRDWGFHDLPQSQRDKAMGHAKYPILRFGLPLNQADEALFQIESGQPYPIKSMVIQESNPLAGHAQDPLRWYAALKKIPFIVGIDLFLTPSLVALADIVLPVACFPEKNSIRAQLFNVSTVNKVVPDYYECKSDAEIGRLIAKRFNPEAWPDSEAEVYDMLCAPSGMTYKEIQEQGVIYPEFDYLKYEKGLLRPDGEPGFNTPSGKFEFYSQFFENFGLDPMPFFAETVYGPYSTPELYEKYPLVMMTGVRNKVAFHTEHRQIDVLREIIPDPYVEINPIYAKEHDIVDGEWVWVENQKDRIKQRAKVTWTVHPKMCLTMHGWWFPEKEGAEPSLFGVWEVNNNRLIEMGHVGPSGFGADVKCVLAKVSKITE